VADRRTGWLDACAHACWREALLHTLTRYALAAPVYCLMPDHAHLLLVGLTERSDQQRALSFLRRYTTKMFAQSGSESAGEKESPDGSGSASAHGATYGLAETGLRSVLREEERRGDPFRAVAHYIVENPVRAGLSKWPRYGVSPARWWRAGLRSIGGNAISGSLVEHIWPAGDNESAAGTEDSGRKRKRFRYVAERLPVPSVTAHSLLEKGLTRVQLRAMPPPAPCSSMVPCPACTAALRRWPMRERQRPGRRRPRSWRRTARAEKSVAKMKHGSLPRRRGVQGFYGPVFFPEQLLQKIWLRGEFDRAAARTMDGRALAILHPGKWNRLGGPDFRGGRLRLGDSDGRGRCRAATCTRAIGRGTAMRGDARTMAWYARVLFPATRRACDTRGERQGRSRCSAAAAFAARPRGIREDEAVERLATASARNRSRIEPVARPPSCRH